MISHVLVAVDDTRESLHAARTAAGLAVGWGASVRVITVVRDSEVAEQLEEIAGPDATARRNDEAVRLLAHVRDEVCQAGIPETSVETVVRLGEPFRRILEEARSWPADLLVMAVSDNRGIRSPYVGSVTQQLMEFAECPVLVVPSRART